MSAAIHTALGGTLYRRIDGWYWSDGSSEPRVRDMLLDELAPNLRCTRRGDTTYVEVPHDWDAARYWPGGRQDTDAAHAIRELLQSPVAVRAPIYVEGLAEALDDHRIIKHGWLIPIEQWDVVMREHVGCWWDDGDEADILARARDLGYTG